MAYNQIFLEFIKMILLIILLKQIYKKFLFFIFKNKSKYHKKLKIKINFSYSQFPLKLFYNFHEYLL